MTGTALKPIDTFKTQLDAALPQMAAALTGTALPVEKFKANVIAAVAANPRLLECTRTSLFQACMSAAQLGLMVDPNLGQFYIVPYRVKGTQVAQGIPGYRGYIHLARQSGEISALYAHPIYEGDEYDVELGTEKKIRHKPKLTGKQGKMVAVYCVWQDKDGNADFEFMSAEEVEAVRKRSRAADNGPWQTDYVQMARKTVIRRAAKYLPLSVQKAAVLDAKADVGEHATIDEQGVVQADDLGPLDFGDDAIDVTEATEPAPPPAKAAAKKQVSDLEARVAAKTAAPPPADEPPPAQDEPPFDAPESEPAPARERKRFKIMPVPSGEDSQPDWDAWAAKALATLDRAPTYNDANDWAFMQRVQRGQMAKTRPELEEKIIAALASKKEAAVAAGEDTDELPSR